VIVGRGEIHPLPDDFIATVWRPPLTETFRVKDYRVDEARVNRDAELRLPRLLINHFRGYVSFRDADNKVQWREGRLK
jgi:hypothetical protein